MGFEFNAVEVKKVDNKKLPALYKCLRGVDGEIVLFLEENKAIAIKSPPDNIWVVGEIENCAHSCFDTDCWERLPVGSSFTFSQE